MKLLNTLVLLLAAFLDLMAFDEVAFKELHLEDGLTNYSILDIEKDNYGYIWVATDEGLNIVSGNKVRKVYKSDQYLPLPANELNCLLNDSIRNIMWIGTQRSGVIGYNYISGETVRYAHTFNKEDKPIPNDITSMALDGNNNLWIASYSNGLTKINLDSGEIERFNRRNIDGLLSNQIWDMEYDFVDNTIYAGHVGGGFSVIDPFNNKAHTYTMADGLPHNNVRKVLSDDDFVWICTDGGFCRYDKLKRTFHNYSSPCIQGAARDVIITDGGLLIAYEDCGIIFLDKNTDLLAEVKPRYTSEAWTNPAMVEITQPSKLFVDSFGDIFLGTLKHGLFALTRNSSYFYVDNSFFRETTSVGQKEAANVIGMTLLPEGELWLATDKLGLFNDENANLHSGFSPYLLAIATDSDNTFWICDRDGNLVHLNHSGEVIDSFNLGIEAEDNMTLEIDGPAIWIGTNSGIILFDKIKKIETGRFGTEERHDFIRKIKKGNDGNLYVGSFGEGLVTFNKDMQIISKNKVQNGFPSNTINDILINGKDIWVATGEGLVRFKQGDMSRFELIALSSRSVRSLVKDHRNNIWFAAGDCIGVVMPGDCIIYFSKELPMRNFNNASAIIDSTGRIYFGSRNGTMTFKPEYVLNHFFHPSPIISGVIIENGSHSSDNLISTSGKSKIELDYADNNFTVVIGNNNIFRQNDSFEYRMIGLNKNWYPVDANNHVAFRALPYGSYLFEVRNARAEKDSEQVIASLRITVLPPFWLTWWAKLIYVVLALIAIAFIVWKYQQYLKRKANETLQRNREKQEQENRDERMAFFTNITHELRTPLTLITGPLDDMADNSSLNEQDSWKIGIIRKNAQRLLGLVNQILDFRKTENLSKRLCVGRGNIVKAVEEITMKYVELNRKRDVKISMNSSEKDIEVLFDKEVLTIILDNLISNAMKYTDLGEISVKVAIIGNEDARNVSIEVADTGHGIGIDALPHVFDRYFQEKSNYQASGTGIGLALVKSLVELHHGTVTAESQKGKGSRFTVFLPLGESYPEAIHLKNPEMGNDSETISEESGKETISEEDNTLILVVEDNEDILDYIEKSLSGIFDVITATNGKEGLEMAQKNMPDIIVSDIMMPVMDGVEMCRCLKNDLNTSHIPVIMLTAKDSVSDREEGYNVGAHSYLTKPFNASLLISRINNVISQRRMLTEHFRRKNLIPMAQDNEKDSASQESKSLLESLGKLDREFIEHLDNLILGCENLEKVNIDYLTNNLCMSRPTLYRKMKAVTGMSGNEYIRHMKMKKAKDLILSGKFNMTEIAEKVGFNSINHFRETFKATFGKTPTEYLKDLKSK